MLKLCKKTNIKYTAWSTVRRHTEGLNKFIYMFEKVQMRVIRPRMMS